jgi:hypothetical protein
MRTEETILTELLKTMDVPEFRRDVTKRSNIEWLARNIQCRNSENIHIQAAIVCIKKLLKK